MYTLFTVVTQLIQFFLRRAAIPFLSNNMLSFEDYLSRGPNNLHIFDRNFRALQLLSKNSASELDFLQKIENFDQHRGNSQRFNPYSDEAGTIAGIAGENFAILAGDTRLSFDGFTVLTRSEEKVLKLNDKVAIASCGFQGDIKQMKRVLTTKFRIYKFDHKEALDVDSAAHMLSRTLYYRRFFPYYTNNIIAGLNDKGEGRLYSYDPIGTIESLPYSAGGHGTGYIDPFFDNEIGRCNKDEKNLKITKDQAVKLMMDAFRGCSERETSTGDKLYMLIFEKGKEPEIVEKLLRND